MNDYNMESNHKSNTSITKIKFIVQILLLLFIYLHTTNTNSSSNTNTDTNTFILLLPSDSLVPG